MLSCNAGEIFTVLAAILLGWPLPLLPLQILWINLITDSLPALALGVDPQESNTMHRPPRSPGSGLFSRRSLGTIVLFGLFIGLITLTAFSIGSDESVEKGRTMAFATLALCQLVHVFNFRSASLCDRPSFSATGRARSRPYLRRGALAILWFHPPLPSSAVRSVEGWLYVIAFR